MKKGFLFLVALVVFAGSQNIRADESTPVQNAKDLAWLDKTAGDNADLISDENAIWEVIGEEERLVALNWSEQSLTDSLDLTALTALKSFTADINEIPYIKVAGHPTLETLICNDNQLDQIDITGCQKLDTLAIANNQIPFGKIKGVKMGTTVNKFTYAPQATIVTDTLRKGYQINLSDFLVDSKKTTVIIRQTDSELAANGKFTLPEILEDYLEIYMQNDSFPDFKGKNEWVYIINRMYDEADRTWYDALSEGLKGEVKWDVVNGVKCITQLDWKGLKTGMLPDTVTFSALKNLTKLDVSGNNIKSIDVKGALNLDSLAVGQNLLDTLDVSTLINLTELVCDNNDLTTLDVSKCVKLKKLNYANNHITFKNLKDNAKAPILTGYIYAPQSIEVIGSIKEGAIVDLSDFVIKGKKTMVTVEKISKELPEDGKFSMPKGLSAPLTLYISNDSLKAFTGDDRWAYNITAAYHKDDEVVIEDFVADYKNKAELLEQVTWEVTGNYLRVIGIDWSDMELKGELDLTGLNKLKELNVAGNELTALNIEGLAQLATLDCSDNTLKALDLSDLPSLVELNCSNNEIAALSFGTSSPLKAYTSVLELLDCSKNKLTALDLSSCNLLEEVDCSSNQLTTLKLTDVIKLNTLDCSNNKLTTLNLADNVILNKIDCSNNSIPFSKLNLGHPLVGDDAYIRYAPQSMTVETSLQNGAVLDLKDFYINDKDTTFVYVGDEVKYRGYLKADGKFTVKKEDVKDNMVVLEMTNQMYTEFNLKPWVYTIKVPVNAGDEAWLNAYVAGKTNAAALKEAVTWAEVDGTLRITEINWDNKSLKGKLDVTPLTAVTKLNVYYNELDSLGVEGLNDMTELNAGSNKLDSIKVNSLKKLVKLDLTGNKLKTLEVKDLTKLTTLTFAHNHISAMPNMEKLTALTVLDFTNCAIESVNLAAQVNLEELSLEFNRLTKLNLSKQTKLTKLKVAHNRLAFDQLLLPATAGLTKGYTYAPQAATRKAVIAPGAEIDLSSFLVAGKTSKVELAGESYDLPANGIFLLPNGVKATDKLELLISNEAYPDFKEKQKWSLTLEGVFQISLNAVDGVSIHPAGDIFVEKGESFTYTITIDEEFDGYQPKVVVNGTNLSESLVLVSEEDRVWKHTLSNITESLEIEISIFDPASIDELDTNQAKVIPGIGMVTVETVNKATVEIYTTMGQQVTRQAINATELFPLSAGQYIVVVNGVSTKVLVQ
ncbi:hypothetical protein LJC35_01660 [Parabacteroides sp. OttesenSCG-928-N08]|nr:hypothetical protein [Parabacteroides sp. OttesenSCG-928-N08]